MGGWSYQTYKATPLPFLLTAIEAINEEAERYGDHDSTEVE